MAQMHLRASESRVESLARRRSDGGETASQVAVDVGKLTVAHANFFASSPIWMRRMRAV